MVRHLFVAVLFKNKGGEGGSERILGTKGEDKSISLFLYLLCNIAIVTRSWLCLFITEC